MEYRYNLTLFHEIGRYYYYGLRTGSWHLFLLNVLGNVCVFIPMGLFLPKLFIKCKNLLLTIILSFEVSLVVEIIQLVTRVGSFDVDDLFLNTIGGVCGFCIYIIYNWLKRHIAYKNTRK